MVNKKNIFFKILFIPISLLLCLCFFVVNTFAYQTNQFSYTLSYDTSTASYDYFNITDSSFYNSNLNEYYLLINVIPSAPYNNNQQIACYLFDNNYTQVGVMITGTAYRNSDIRPIQTLVFKSTSQGAISSSMSKIGLSLKYKYTNNEIINIDLVKGTDIYLSQYVSTYISNLENQVDTLTNQYNNLSNDYEELESNYETLNDNYEQLEIDYQNLSNASNGANGFYNNVSRIAFSDEGLVYEELNVDNAYLFLNNSTLKFKDLLSSNGIYNVQQHQTQRQNLEINLIEPINFSNYIFYFMFENAYNIIGGNPSDYYIAFSGRGYNSQIFYFDDLDYINGVGYKLELNNNMFVDTIDFYWNNTEILQCWPLVMSSSEYNLGYQKGNSIGYSNGYNVGYRIGEENGIDIGHSSGYQEGFNDGMETDLSTNGVKTLFNSILSFPVDMIKNVFDFDFMGVNVASVIMFIISIGIVAFVIKKFL